MSGKYQVKSGDTLWTMAERFYGDGRRHPSDRRHQPSQRPRPHPVVGQELEIPYVTFRHRVKASDTKKQLALHFYNDIDDGRSLIEIPIAPLSATSSSASGY